MDDRKVVRLWRWVFCYSPYNLNAIDRPKIMDPITIIILIVILVFLIKSLTGAKDKEKKEKIEKTLKHKRIVEEARAYIEEAKKQKQLPVVPCSIMLGENEKAYFEEETKFIEPRAVRNGGGGGVRFRVVKGVYVGGFGGQGESHQELRIIDEGKVTLTNEKIFFSGSKESRTIPINKIIKVDPSIDGIRLEVESHSKNVSFLIGNSLAWGAVIGILHSVNGDVSKLTETLFDNSLEWLKIWEVNDSEPNQN
jgi:hypothetical protein